MYDLPGGIHDQHWWNGRWGHLARRDIYLRVDSERITVDAREGGPDGASRTWHPPTAEDTLQLLTSLMDDQDGWRELSVRPARSPASPPA